MPEEISLNRILSIEDSPAVVDIVCPATGAPLWALIRAPFIRVMLSDMLYEGSIGGDDSGGAAAHRVRIAVAVARSFLHNALNSPSAASPNHVVVIASGARLVKTDGRYFNCLGDYFVDAAPGRTLLVEEMFKWNWPFPRRNCNMLFHTPLRVRGTLHGKAHAAKYRALSKSLVDLVCARAKELLGFEFSAGRKKTLENMCASGAASLPARVDAYVELFTRCGAKLVLKEEGCYGGADNVSAMVAARRMGIAVAEYQHGAVSSGHDAYNFAHAVRESAQYRAVLPDYFLAYGAWWADQVNVPVQKVVIGNPHRSTLAAKAPAAPASGKRILVLGDGIDTESYLRFCEALASMVDKTFPVVFRPHPLERRRLPAMAVPANVEVDGNQDIYTSLRESGTVVSEVSTGLFEAVGIVPNIFIWNTAKSRFAFPSHPFSSFDTPCELVKLIESGSGVVSEQQARHIWSPDWETNYARFLAGFLGAHPEGGVALNVEVA